MPPSCRYTRIQHHHAMSSILKLPNSTFMSLHPIGSALHGPRPSSPRPSIQSMFLALQNEKIGVTPDSSTFVRSSIWACSYPNFIGFECILVARVWSLRLNAPCLDNLSLSHAVSITVKLLWPWRSSTRNLSKLPALLMKEVNTSKSWLVPC